MTVVDVFTWALVSILPAAGELCYLDFDRAMSLAGDLSDKKQPRIVDVTDDEKLQEIVCKMLTVRENHLDFQEPGECVSIDKLHKYGLFS